MKPAHRPLPAGDADASGWKARTAVGFGDIIPRADVARVVTMVQMLGDLVFVGLVLQVMIGAVKLGLRRRATALAGFPDSSNQGDAGPAAN